MSILFFPERKKSNKVKSFQAMYTLHIEVLWPRKLVFPQHWNSCMAWYHFNLFNHWNSHHYDKLFPTWYKFKYVEDKLSVLAGALRVFKPLK